MLKKAQQFGFQLVISLKHFQLGVGSFGLDGCLPRDLTAPHHHFSSGSWEKPAVNSFQGKWPVFFQLRKNSGKIRRNMFLPSQKRTPRIGSQVTPFGVFPKKWWYLPSNISHPKVIFPFLVGKNPKVVGDFPTILGFFSPFFSPFFFGCHENFLASCDPWPEQPQLGDPPVVSKRPAFRQGQNP